MLLFSTHIFIHFSRTTLTSLKLKKIAQALDEGESFFDNSSTEDPFQDSVSEYQQKSSSSDESDVKTVSDKRKNLPTTHQSDGNSTDSYERVLEDGIQDKVVLVTRIFIGPLNAILSLQENIYPIKKFLLFCIQTYLISHQNCNAVETTSFFLFFHYHQYALSGVGLV